MNGRMVYHLFLHAYIVKLPFVYFVYKDFIPISSNASVHPIREHTSTIRPILF